MAQQTRDFSGLKIPDLVKGAPWGRGFLHTLTYYAEATILKDDDLILTTKVPNDEHWYILQWLVSDNTYAGVPNGWEAQALAYNIDKSVSPKATTADPSPKGNFPEPSTAPGIGIKNWLRWWDGSTYIQWADYKDTGVEHYSVVIVRCTDPVWSMPRVRPGTQMNLISIAAENDGGGPGGLLWEVVVMRYRLEDYDFRELSKLDTPGFVALMDVHMQQHRAPLGD